MRPGVSLVAFYNARMRDERTGRQEASGPSRLFTILAGDPADVVAAQRLRFHVFAEEMGARLSTAAEGGDRDGFDAYCDHLLLRERATQAVVGTYRILPDTAAARVGRFYAAAEFDLGRIPALPRLAEVGRACIHPDYRTGAALGTLLAGLAGYIRDACYEYVIGCARIPVDAAPGPAA